MRTVDVLVRPDDPQPLFSTMTMTAPPVFAGLNHLPSFPLFAADLILRPD